MEIIIKPDGAAVLRTVTEQPCKLVENIMEQLSTNAVRSAPNIFESGSGKVGIVLTKNEVYLGCRLAKLHLSMNWLCVKDKMVPRPAPMEPKPQGVFMGLDWVPVNGMSVIFMAKVETSLHIENRRCFLLAYDTKARNFQLPLPNIFDDCSICMGEYDNRGGSLLECFQKALTNFMNSPWNSDLMEGDKLLKLQSLVQYQIDKGEEDRFFQESNGSLWWNHCYSRETRITEVGRRLL
jgi:hypothetical protein